MNPKNWRSFIFAFPLWRRRIIGRKKEKEEIVQELELTEIAIQPIAFYDTDKNDELTTGSRMVDLESGFPVLHNFLELALFGERYRAMFSGRMRHTSISP